MKVSQISSGRSYENKKGTEVRYVKYVGDGKVRYVVQFPEPPRAMRFVCRDVTVTAREFAQWAHRPQGTSTHNSGDQQKFLNMIKGPTD